MILLAVDRFRYVTGSEGSLPRPTCFCFHLRLHHPSVPFSYQLRNTQGDSSAIVVWDRFQKFVQNQAAEHEILLFPRPCGTLSLWTTWPRIPHEH
jgi:hypothetical protein